MAWFQRGKDVEPTSLEQYYADQQRRGAGAWLMALGAFLVTLILVFGIFWGGRWIYRKVTHKDNSAQIATKPEGNPFSNANIKTDTSKKPQGVVNAPTNPSSSSSSSSSSTAQTTPPPAAGSTTSPQTQATGPITNTGPGDQLAIFIAVTVAGTLLYQLRLRYANAKQCISQIFTNKNINM